MRIPRAARAVVGALLLGGAATLFSGDRDRFWTAAAQLGALPAGVERDDLNLLLITLDTTRADRLGAYGYHVQTPSLDRLAEEGVLFEQAVSPVPFTLPAHGSLFTGRFPPSHGVRGNGGVFDAGHTTLAEVLEAAGFRTAAFVGSYVLDSVWGLDQGFDLYSDGFDAPEFTWLPRGQLQRPADRVADAALRWIHEAQSSRFFAWLHFYDPHAPYRPPEPYRTVHADSPYDGEIAFVDAQIGRVLRFLEERRLLDRTIVVAIGDHGESLGDHGEQTHGFFVYESVIHVPFIVRAPFSRIRGTRVSAVTRTVDVMPTVLDLLGLRPQPHVEGTSLAPLMSGVARDPGLHAYAETLFPRQRFGWSDLRSIRSGRFKLIAAPRMELYDLSTDPREETNLYDTHRRLGERLAARLHLLERRFGPARPEASAAPLSPVEAARLATLGYVAGRRLAGAASGGRQRLADPKDKIDEYNATSQRPSAGDAEP
jgi:arylsulfatase A-like enzyme